MNQICSSGELFPYKELGPPYLIFASLKSLRKALLNHGERIET